MCVDWEVAAAVAVAVVLPTGDGATCNTQLRKTLCTSKQANLQSVVVCVPVCVCVCCASSSFIFLCFSFYSIPTRDSSVSPRVSAFALFTLFITKNLFYFRSQSIEV